MAVLEPMFADRGRALDSDTHPDAVGEGIVDGVPLVDHGCSTLVEQALDLVAVVLGCGTLALRLLDVVIAELGPSLRN